MKTDIKFDSMVQEIKRQQTAKKDFIVPNKMVKFSAMSGKFEALIEMPDSSTHKFGLTANAHNQLRTYLGYNSKSYDRMLKYEPGLLAINANQWFGRTEEPFDFANQNRMVRTLDGNIRAFLSDSYLRLDNYDLLLALYKTFENAGQPVEDGGMGLRFESISITENRFYMKAVTAKQMDVRPAVGDIVQAGVIISNSEVGHGKLKVIPMTFRLWCANGCAHAQYKDAISRTHRGKTQEIGMQAFKAYGARFIPEREIMSKVVKSVNEVLKGAWFETIAGKMTAAADVQIEDKDKAVEVLTNRSWVSEAEADLIMDNYLRNAHFNGETLFGLVNAVTRTSQDDSVSYDRASELEELGDKLLDMAKLFA